MKLKMIVSLALLLLFFSLGNRGNLGGSGPKNRKNSRRGQDWRGQELVLKVINHHDSQAISGALVSITLPGSSIEAGRSDALGQVRLSLSPIHDFPFRLRVSHPDFEDLDWHLRGEWLSGLSPPLVRMVAKDALRTCTITYDWQTSEPVYLSWRWALIGDGLMPTGRCGAKICKPGEGPLQCVMTKVPVDAHVEVYATGQHTGAGDFFTGVVGDGIAMNEVVRSLAFVTHRGRVEGALGCAMEGAEVRLVLGEALGRPLAFQGTTDELGEFEITLPRWLSEKARAGESMWPSCDIAIAGMLVPSVPLRFKEGRLATIRLDHLRSEDVSVSRPLKRSSRRK